MATFTKYWTGTSGDKITITVPITALDQTLSVVSDPNTQPTARSTTIDFKTTKLPTEEFKDGDIFIKTE